VQQVFLEDINQKSSDQGASEEMAILGMHLSGMSVEEVMCAAQWRSPAKSEGCDNEHINRKRW
jgi:hypothetical protein